MPWTNNTPASRVFRAFLADVLDNTAAFDLTTDTFNVALYDDSITPLPDAASAATAYGAGVWETTGGIDGTNGAQRFEVGQWEQGGEPLTNTTLNQANEGSTGVVFWDATDTASGDAADLSGVVGCLVYDASLTLPVADQGVCFNHFGGSNSVVNGTFTVIWSSQGILRSTL